MKKRSWIIIGIIIILFMLGMFFTPKIRTYFFNEQAKNTNAGQKTDNKKSPLTVNIKILSYETLKDEFFSKGIILPDEEIDLAFESSGKITNIYFQEGTTVSKGQLLAKINDSGLQAELKKLESQVKLAEDRVFRQKQLLEKEAVSQETYETVVTDLNKLNADIELVKTKIQLTELYAPFSGVIGLRFVSEGAFASPSLVLARLTKISPVKIEFSVNEKQANELKVGTPISFTIDNDTNTYKANIYAIESKLDEKTLSLKARAIYQNTNGKIKPGFSTNVNILLKEIKNAIVVPSISVVAEMGMDYVFVYRGGKAKQVFVQKGIRTASSLQITDGLKLNDTLILSGVMQLRDGSDVILNTAK